MNSYESYNDSDNFSPMPPPPNIEAEIHKLWEDPQIIDLAGEGDQGFRFAIVAQIYARNNFNQAYETDNTMNEEHPLWRAVEEADHIVSAYACNKWKHQPQDE